MSGFENWPAPILRRWLLSAAAGPVIFLIGLAGRIAPARPNASDAQHLIGILYGRSMYSAVSSDSSWGL